MAVTERSRRLLAIQTSIYKHWPSGLILRQKSPWLQAFKPWLPVEEAHHQVHAQMSPKETEQTLAAMGEDYEKGLSHIDIANKGS